ncbi:hypothetical protein J2W34_000072 [Variovorax boronicumulans]|uniref:hypothetical protein n=1 Tax=Variovorax boronicumulans TaxID=436515 RepID=UPI00278062F6|nr:hypothetical protein [Variovorax boronicumulans]MDQ0068298.1 hypothetical protein [Variovorax boronicumulans]
MTPELSDEMVAGMDDMSEDHMREDHIVVTEQPIYRATVEGCYFSEEGERARLAARTGGIPHA